MNYTSRRPSKFGKDQKVYTWNGTLYCVHCHQITEKGKCPQDCHRNKGWTSLGFDEQGVRFCDDCQSKIRGGQDEFTRFDFDDGRIAEVVCSSCSAVRLDQKIADGDLLQAPDGSYFEP